MDFNVHFPNFDEVKIHVKKHQMKYAVGTTTVVVSGITFLVTRQFGVRTITVAPVFNNVINNDNSSTVHFGGHMTKMVKRLSDGKIWESVTEAVEEIGCSFDKMSRHLNGHKSHVDNEVYKLIGVGTTG